MVYLMKGGACFSKDMCDERATNFFWSQLTTSNQCEDEMELHGIFSPDPNESPMHDANKVFLWYCSSDQHYGDTSDE